MASDHEDDPPSRQPSDSSADDSDSQDSDSMARSTEAGGVRRDSKSASSKKGPNDPHREKRKKAKRACRPCQVAHLTCGDERPCSRCVKRGCAHICKDGVRKKAKYLADTPAEALTQELGTRGRPPVSNSQNFLSRAPLPELPGGMQRGIYPGPPLPYGSGTQSNQSFNPLSAPQSYGNQPGVLPPNYDLGTGQHQMPGQGYGTVLPSGAPDPLQGDFSGDMFAPFDTNYLDNLNFENRFAAAEFGMLGNLTAGMANSPPGDGAGPFQPGAGTFTPNTSSSFAQSPVDLQASAYPGRGPPQWSKDGQSRIKYESGSSRNAERPQEMSDRIKQEAPPALAIGSSAYPSPTSGSSPQGTKGAREDLTTARNTFTNIHLQRQSPAHPEQPSRRPPPPMPTVSASMGTTTFIDPAAPLPRHRNPLEVYSNVTQPYSYTAGFHSLTALIQKRFSPQKTAHIAKALAAIRPSFISCTMKLNRDDLIFMEKCLQRTLWGLEEVIAATGTPTIVCRRTGEVVAVGKEFSILTGWRKDVLLGKAPNLNANTGGDASESMETAEAISRGGQNTPRGPDSKAENPVNIVSILDDDSACDFFDDYAHLAFGDSRGAVNTPCRLLKYRTADEIDFSGFGDVDTHSTHTQQNIQSRPSSGIGPSKIPKGDSKVACMLCWTVKRDVFDIPMLFVMNLLPCI